MPPGQQRRLPGINASPDAHETRSANTMSGRSRVHGRGMTARLPDALKSERDSLTDTDAHGAKREGQSPVLELDRGCKCQPCS